MVKQERTHPERSLNRLQWLIQRSKVGFKGNPPPFEPPKTQKSVALAKKKAADQLAGEADFLPFYRGAPSLAEDARPTKHLRGADNSRFEQRAGPRELNYHHQRMDKSTGRPEIDSALCWDLKGNAADAQKTQKTRPARPDASPHALKEKCGARRFGNPYLNTLSRAERAAVFRADILSHPKFTSQSREFRAGDAWYRGSQLEGPLHVKTHGEMQNMESLADTGKIRLLIRSDGVSRPLQTYGISHLATAMDEVRSLPFVPRSHKELIIPSMAELYDEETDNTATANANMRPIDFAWVELECDDDATIEKVMSLFPIHPSTKKSVKSGITDSDVAEIFPSCGYVCINVAARHANQLSLGDEGNEPVNVCMVVFERFLLTILRKPVAGGDEVRAQLELLLSSRTPHAEPVSVLVCALISAFVKEYQKEPSSLLVDVDNVNELVLQIQPSRCDQMDVLRRIEDLRHRLTRVQTAFLAKERLVQQLMLPVMRCIFITSEPSALSRYQRLLSGLQLSNEHLRKGRDVLNLSSMSLVSGVSMRLLQHCYWMDFLGSVMTQAMLVAMPVSIIPGLFTMNVKVPYQESTGLMAFSIIALVTGVLFFTGMLKPLLVYIQHKPPGALVPPSLS